jgi:hypothetical protein
MLLLTFSFSSYARPNQACEDFKKIHALLATVTPSNVREFLPEADWVDSQNRRRDRTQATVIVVKTIVLGITGYLSPFTYAFEPSRLGVGSMTGMYVSNPENFAEFLQLEPRHACQYLSMNDSHAILLRQLTRETWAYLRSVRR